MGAGRTEMARALFGADPKQSGSIYIGGEKWRLNLRRMPSDMESVIFRKTESATARRRKICCGKNTTMACLENYLNGF